MDRREALGILGALVPTTATLVAGCPAGEPPDIARADARRDGLLERTRIDDFDRGFRSDWQFYVGGTHVFTAEFREWCLSIRSLPWPKGVTPTVHRHEGDCILTVEWNANTDGPWIGRPVRIDQGRGLVELVGNEWLPVGRLAGEP